MKLRVLLQGSVADLVNVSSLWRNLCSALSWNRDSFKEMLSLLKGAGEGSLGLGVYSDVGELSLEAADEFLWPFIRLNKSWETWCKASTDWATSLEAVLRPTGSLAECSLKLWGLWGIVRDFSTATFLWGAFLGGSGGGGGDIEGHPFSRPVTFWQIFSFGWAGNFLLTNLASFWGWLLDENESCFFAAKLNIFSSPTTFFDFNLSWKDVIELRLEMLHVSSACVDKNSVSSFFNMLQLFCLCVKVE